MKEKKLERKKYREFKDTRENEILLGKCGFSFPPALAGYSALSRHPMMNALPQSGPCLSNALGVGRPFKDTLGSLAKEHYGFLEAPAPPLAITGLMNST